MNPERLADGSILLDASTTVDADEVRAAQAELAEWRLKGHDTVHIAGAVDADDVIETMDALGRRTVRLNIGHLLVVGESAFVMHLAAQHEGSWDGESLPLSTVESAYDEVTRLRGDGVVILVTGSTDCDMTTVVDRLKE